jgi:hypothetical protein
VGIGTDMKIMIRYAALILAIYLVGGAIYVAVSGNDVGLVFRRLLVFALATLLGAFVGIVIYQNSKRKG